MSVCPSFRTYRRGSHRTDFRENWCLGCFIEELSRKLGQSHTKISGTVLEDLVVFFASKKKSKAVPLQARGAQRVPGS